MAGHKDYIILNKIGKMDYFSSYDMENKSKFFSFAIGKLHLGASVASIAFSFAIILFMSLIL